MLKTIWQTLRALWRPLLATDLLFKAIAVVLLTPMVSFLFRGFLAFSGRTVLADTDIIHFLLAPIGWLTMIVVGGASIGVLVLEQSALMTVSLAWTHKQKLTVWESLWFVRQRTPGIFRIAARMVVRVLLLAAPFLAVGGGLYLLLLTKYDINFYLTERPPVFWTAVALIGLTLALLTALIIRCVVSWSVAFQLHLFENTPPGECLNISRERVVGHRRLIAKWVVGWLVINSLISSLAAALVLGIGRLAVPAAAAGVWLLIITLGMLLLLWGVMHLGTSLLAVISFAVLQGHVYDRFGRSEQFALPEQKPSLPAWSLKWTRGRLLAAVALAVVGALLVSTSILHTISLEDDVEITAHRGGALNAPENTLAAIRRAIDDGTDWVEIDVQETKDGVVVVAHDSDLKKVAGVATKIWDGTADELRSIDIGSFFGPEFKEERLPTLAEVLDVCHGKVGVNIELKYYGHDQDLERRVIDLVEAHDMVGQIVIMSLKPEAIRKVKKLRPDWTVGTLTAVAAGDLSGTDVDFLAVKTDLAKRRFIHSAHQRGKEVYAWTVNDAISMSTMISRGVDNLITDRPDLARRVLAERAELSPVERVLVELAFLFGVVPDRSYPQ